MISFSSIYEESSTSEIFLGFVQNHWTYFWVTCNFVKDMKVIE